MEKVLFIVRLVIFNNVNLFKEKLMEKESKLLLMEITFKENTKTEIGMD